MRCAIIGWIVGAGILQSQAQLPAWSTLGAFALVALLLACLRGPLRALLAGGLLGFCWAALLAQAALGQELALGDEGRDIAIVGTVDSLPYVFDSGTRFPFTVERAEAAVPGRIMLAWYGEGAARPMVQPGERWRFRVRLQRPHGNANPYGFDYEVWLLEQGIRATGYVRAGERIDGFVFGFRNLVERQRAALRDHIRLALGERPYAGVIVALVVGDQRGIEQSDWTVFNRTGIGHLISISGLHITMVAGLCAWLAGFLWRRSFFTAHQLPLLLPAQKVAALCGAAVALAYVLLAGFGIPAQRTLYMLTVVAAAAWSGRLSSVSHVLCWAAGLVVLLDPWAVLAPGFWLSFGAVAVILYAGVGRVTPIAGDMWRAALRTQYAVTVGLVPLTMLLFAQVSIVSPLANAVAIPVVSLVVTPLALAGSVLPQALGTPVLLLAHAVVQALAALLGMLAAEPIAVWTAPRPTLPVFAFAVLGTLWMLAPRGWPLRWTGALAWLPLLAAVATRPAPGVFTATAFDVGQGTAVLIETEHHRMLYDTGPRYSPDADAANRVLLPYLKGRGIGALDLLMISHSDLDHSGGALTLLHAVAVQRTVSSLPPGHPIVKASRHVPCLAGQHWHWDGIEFSVLHPSAYQPGQKSNAMSCTLKVDNGHRALLLTGDIEAGQEASLIERHASLQATVLMAPHHGSGTSSSASFLAAVRPRVAVFQVGHRNRYGHPKAEVVQRYRARDIDALRTDEAGAVTMRFGDDVTVEAYRDRERRYWYGR